MKKQLLDSACLKRCPCCGSKPTMVGYRGESPWMARVVCLTCGLRTKRFMADTVATPEEAAACFWNRRAPSMDVPPSRMPSMFEPSKQWVSDRSGEPSKEDKQ